MAISATYLSASNGDTTEGSHDSTFDVTTALGRSLTTSDLLIIAAQGTPGGAAGYVADAWTTPSKSSGTATIGTVTPVAKVTNERANPDGPASQSTTSVWQVAVTGGGTLVLAWGDAVATFGGDLTVVVITGHDTGTPIGGTTTGSSIYAGAGPTRGPQFSTGGAALGTGATEDLSAAPATDDLTICFVNGDTDAGSGKGWTAGAGFTERAESTSTTNYCGSHVQDRTGSTSATVTWPTNDDTPNVYSVSGVALVVKAAAGGGGADPDVPLLNPLQVRNFNVYRM